MLHKSWCFILILITQLCLAQADFSTLHFDHLSIDNGLSHNTVFSLLQDRYGYIWIGTQNGLNKYDGYSFEIYQSDDIQNDEKSFVGTHISSLFEDKKGNLWVGTKDHGINFKSKSSDRFLNLQNDSSFIQVTGSEISSFYEDKAANIWITTIGSGVLKYNPDTKEVNVFNTKNSKISSDIAFDIVEDANETIWIGTAGVGLNFITAERGDIGHLNLPNGPNMNGFRKKLLLDEGYLWIGTQGTGLYKINLKDFSFIHLTEGNTKRSIISDGVIDLLKTNDGRLFIATEGDGMSVYNTHTEEMSSYKYNANKQSALNSNGLRCLLNDRTHNVWIGTFNGGVNIYKPNKTWFDFYVPNRKNSNLSSKSILSIIETKNGQIFLGTDGGGLSWLTNEQDAMATSYLIHQPADRKSISANEVKSLYEDRKGRLWVGLFAGGLDLYNPNDQTFEHVIEGNYNVWSITEIKKSNQLLIATLGDGLFTVDLETKQFAPFRPKSTTLNSHTDFNITCVYVDNSDRIWIGSLNNGLDLIDESNHIYKHFANAPADSASISNNEIRTIFEDSERNIWVGTEGGGLNRWLGQGSFERITVQNGLLDNNVMGIVEDKNHMIWISTFQGISKFDRKIQAIQNFSFRSFQNSNQFNQNAILTASNGKLLFGGINGLHAIQPEIITKNNVQPDLIFTDLKIFGKSIRVGKLYDGRTILKEPLELSRDVWMSYLDQSFTIYFAAIDYTNPLENEFAYQLEGFNETWLLAAKGKPSATYTNLNPGSYVFKIKHKEKTASINIHIKPAFWQTSWFKFLTFVISLGLIFTALFFWIKRREAATNRKILQLTNEKLATEVAAKNSKLMFSSVQMAHKNEILTEVKENLVEIDNKQERNLRPIIHKLNYELKNENYWKEFNVYFNEVDQNFLDRILKTHPELTKNDLRICSLLRMNMSTKEIASLLNISVRAVEQSRYRLKKRFGLDK
ncbi:MAG: hypothetical protein RLZZ337_1307, partial [Bacteroidota bacterium]